MLEARDHLGGWPPATRSFRVAPLPLCAATEIARVLKLVYHKKKLLHGAKPVETPDLGADGQPFPHHRRTGDRHR